MIRRGLALILAALACGCGTPEPPVSSDLATGEIGLGVHLRSNGALAQIFVTPWHEDAILELTGGDRLLIAEAGGPEHVLTPGEREFLGQLETDAVAFDLIFERGSGERVTSPLALPPPFELAGPTGPAPRSMPIPITWEATTGVQRTELRINAPCLQQSVNRSFEIDTGSYQIQPADLVIEPSTGECDFWVDMTRSIVGAALAPELAGGNPPQLAQERTLTIATIP
jgi:hypothetical protein